MGAGRNLLEGLTDGDSTKDSHSCDGDQLLKTTRERKLGTPRIRKHNVDVSTKNGEIPAPTKVHEREKPSNTRVHAANLTYKNLRLIC